MTKADAMAPIVALEGTVVAGRTYQAYKRGKWDEARERFIEEKKLFLDRWQSVIDKGDPYYNPNLSLDEGYAVDVDKLREE